MSVLMATSIVSAASGRGRVDLHHDDLRFAQVSVEEARAWALNILEAAEAAETDAILMAFFNEEFNVPRQQAAVIMNTFRARRDKERSL